MKHTLKKLLAAFERGAELLWFITPHSLLRKSIYYFLIASLIFGSVFGKTTYESVSAFIGGKIGGANLAGSTNGTSLGNYGHNKRQPASVAAANLKAYYPLDGNANDAAAITGNDLTDNNTVPQAARGLNAATFSNVDYLSHADNASLSTGDIDFSIAGWVYFTSAPTLPFLITKENDSAGLYEYVLMYHNGTSPNGFLFCVSSNGADCNVGDYISAANFGPAVANQWYFVAAWHDSVGDTINISVNNGTPNSTGFVGGPDNTNADFWLGGGYNHTDNPLNGYLDSWGFWKKTLSSQDRTDLYNAGRGVTYSQLNSSLTTSLNGWWDLDEASGATRLDSTSQDNDLTNTGTVGTVAGHTGPRSNFGTEYNGSDESLSVADTASLSIGTGNSVTVAGWAYADAIGATDTIATKGSGNLDTSTEYWLGLGSNGKFRLTISNGTTGSTLDSTATYIAGQWYYVIGWFDNSTNTMGISVNDTSNTTTGGATDITDNAQSFKIGTDSSLYWDGKLDEIAVWKRVLTSAERTALYNNGRGVTYDNLLASHKINLSSWWAMEEPSGTRYDSHRYQLAPATVTGATATTGKFDKAYSFSGSSQYITLPADVVTSSVSLSAWVKPTSGASSVCNTVVAKGDGASGATTNWILSVGFNGTTCGTASMSFFFSGSWHSGSYTPGFQADQWYHVVGSFNNSTDAWAVYVDGVSLGSGTDATAPYTAGTAAPKIGKQGESVGNYFFGTIDDVRIYDVGLTSTEVDTLYGASSAPACDQTCTGLWKNDDTTLTSGTTNSVAAAASYTHTLTDNNTVTQESGKIGNAAHFAAASSEYLSVTDTSAQTPTTDFTVAAWVYFDTLPTGDYPAGYGAIVTKDESANRSFWLVYNTVTEKFSFFISLDGSNYFQADSSTAISATTWYHVVGWFDPSVGNDLVGISVNAGTANETTGVNSAESIYDGTAALEIGKLWGTDSLEGYITGKIDEVAIWDRMLTSGERTSLYNSGTGKALTSLTAAEQVGLVSYWNMEEASGSRYDMKYRTAITGATANEGVYRGGFNYDGTDDITAQVDPDTLDMGASQDFSVSGWFNRDTFTTDDTVFAKRAGITAGDAGYLAYIDDSDDKFYFEASDGTDEYSLTSTTTYTATGWHYFAVTWDDDGTPKLYIDGKDETSASGTLGNVGDLSNTQQFAMGAESDVGNPFDGRLDDIRVYNRALAPYEAYEQYLAGK